MERWILDYHRQISSLVSLGAKGQKSNILMGTKAIARGDYKPDRAWDLKGVAAYDREKKKYMKDLGLATKDDLITQRMLSYLSHVTAGRDTTPLVRDFGLRMKLQCPQSVSRFFKSGHRQAGYAHYRARPLLMFLYAIKSGAKHTVTVNTDDIALSAFLYFTPADSAQVDEPFLAQHIDDYFQRKSQHGIDYEARFRALFAKVEAELGKPLSHPDAFPQKSRNAGNEIYCTSIFLRNVGLIDIDEVYPKHWSCTQMTYGKTGPAGYGVFSLRTTGTAELSKGLSRLPVWGEDVKKAFGDDWASAANVISRLSRKNLVKANKISTSLIAALASFGIKLRSTPAGYTSINPPDFDLQYDLG